MRLQFVLDNGQTGRYSFRIGAEREGGYSVQYEECRLHSQDSLGLDTYYRVEDGLVAESSDPIMPAAARDRLYLVNASGLPAFRPVYDAFSRMAFYNLNPDRIRSLQSPDVGELLNRDGSNLASVFARMASRSPAVEQRIEEYLSKVVPGIEGVDAKEFGSMETLEFRQRVRGSEYPWRFLAANMSDGTLRALGILTALLQNYDPSNKHITLAGIEEPEIALHPAAAGVLRDVLAEGSLTTQIVVTSHSPDLLDDQKISSDSILSVSASKGETLIRPIGEVAKRAIRDELYTAGELLRLNQLTDDESEETQSSDAQTSLMLGVDL
jgi:predicted ATPase